MGEHLFPTEPDPASTPTFARCWKGPWWRLDAQALDARWAGKVVLNEVGGRIGLTLQALRASRAPVPGLPKPRSPGG